MNTFAIDVHELTKTFDKKTVVDHVTLQVKKGAVFGFLGSNGSGKTTMIRMICGLLTPSSGSGTCLGYDIKTQRTKIKEKIAYMPQKFSLYMGLSVYENLQFIADVYQIKNPQQAIQAILKDLALTPYKDIKAENLSGGWKQSLTLASCLLHQPSLLFLDEPTAGIDPKARRDFWNYLHKIAIRDGTTVLVTTHYMDEAEKCTDLAYIHLGHLLYSGPTKDLIPFSQVKTLLIETNRQSLNEITEKIKQSYPNLLISMVNNDLRVSSSDEEQLEAFATHSQYSIKEVRPNFEEVFIGLVK